MAHKNDTSLNAPGTTATWPLEPPADERGWRFFRVHMTGPNSSGNAHYLSLSGWEMYGRITGVQVESFQQTFVQEERAQRRQRALSRAMSAHLTPGMRVGRGPDWKWGSQNGDPDGTWRRGIRRQT